jgi:hypothetical protein
MVLVVPESNYSNYDSIKITPNYVDEDFENAIISLVPVRPVNSKKRNQILRFGNSIPYGDNIVSKDIPEIFSGFHDDIDFDSITINEYYPGQTIDWHIDQPLWLKSVHIISLLSDAELKFKRDKEIISFFLPRYSLSEFSGDLRYKWEHSLTASSKRYSVVFRSSKKQ